MKGCGLGFAVLASLLLLVIALSEDVPTLPAAPDVARSDSDHQPTGQLRQSKAWWKKWIQESRRKEIPRPGVYSPLLKNNTNIIVPRPRPGIYTPLSGKDPK